MTSPSLADRVQETTTTTGTGAVSMGGAVSAYQAFSAAFATASVIYYCIAGALEWEVGIGTLTSGTPWTLSRDTVLASSNNGNLVSFSAGTKNVFCDWPAFALRTANWGIVKRSVDVGETMTIPDGYQAIFASDFTNSGTLNNSGIRMVI